LPVPAVRPQSTGSAGHAPHASARPRRSAPTCWPRHADRGDPSIAGAGAVQGYHASDGDQDACAEADASPSVTAVDIAEIAAQDGARGSSSRRPASRSCPSFTALEIGRDTSREHREGRPAMRCSHATVISPPIMSPFLWILQMRDEVAAPRRRYEMAPLNRPLTHRRIEPLPGATGESR
jgi:hypothetical protein